MVSDLETRPRHGTAKNTQHCAELDLPGQGPHSSGLDALRPSQRTNQSMRHYDALATANLPRSVLVNLEFFLFVLISGRIAE
jgi:hypothetical protein